MPKKLHFSQAMGMEVKKFVKIFLIHARNSWIH